MVREEYMLKYKMIKNVIASGTTCLRNDGGEVCPRNDEGG